MKKLQVLLLFSLFFLISGCMSRQNTARLSLINLTQEYLALDSEDERAVLAAMIEDSFIELNGIGDDHFLVPKLPEDIKKKLMKDIDEMGFGAKDPKWTVAYSCNGFHYIIGFTCLVKRKIHSNDGPAKEKWMYDKGRDYFLFDGVSLKKYPMVNID